MASTGLSPRIIDRPVTVDRPSSASGGSTMVTFWGERVRTRLPARATNGMLSILDYRAPAGFGPPRHLHHREDEIFEVVSGRCVVWTPSRSYALAPGDLVLLPKDAPHAWRAYGEEPLHMTVTLTPGGMERLFENMTREGLNGDDLATMRAIGERAGVELVGPPLSDEDVLGILAELGVI